MLAYTARCGMQRRLPDETDGVPIRRPDLQENATAGRRRITFLPGLWIRGPASSANVVPDARLFLRLHMRRVLSNVLIAVEFFARQESCAMSR